MSNQSSPDKIFHRIVFGIIVPSILVTQCVITIFINTKNRELQRRISTVFVNNLAVSSGLIGASTAIFVILRMSVFPETDLWCNPKVYPYYWVLTYFHLVSVLCLVCVSFDRYLAICWPLRYRELLTFSRGQSLAGACWLLSTMSLLIPTVSAVLLQQNSNHSELQSNSVESYDYVLNHLSNERVSGEKCMDKYEMEAEEVEVWLFSRKVFIITYVLMYFLSLFIIICMYGLVSRELCILKQRAHATESMKKEDNRARRKTAQDFFLVVFLYFTLSMPHVMLKVSTVEWRTSQTKYQVTTSLVFIHQILFLPIYAWRFAEFRKELCALKICKVMEFLNPWGRCQQDPSTSGHVEVKAVPSATSSTSTQSSVISAV